MMLQSLSQVMGLPSAGSHNTCCLPSLPPPPPQPSLSGGMMEANQSYWGTINSAAVNICCLFFRSSIKRASLSAIPLLAFPLQTSAAAALPSGIQPETFAGSTTVSVLDPELSLELMLWQCHNKTCCLPIPLCDSKCPSPSQFPPFKQW